MPMKQSRIKKTTNKITIRYFIIFISARPGKPDYEERVLKAMSLDNVFLSANEALYKVMPAYEQLHAFVRRYTVVFYLKTLLNLIVLTLVL